MAGYQPAGSLRTQNVSMVFSSKVPSSTHSLIVLLIILIMFLVLSPVPTPPNELHPHGHCYQIHFVILEHDEGQCWLPAQVHPSKPASSSSRINHCKHLRNQELDLEMVHQGPLAKT